MNCPPHELLKRCLTGELSDVDSDAVLTHVDSCERCQSLACQLEEASPNWVAELANVDSLEIDRCGELVSRIESWSKTRSLPATVDDYELLARLGEGGMGTVYQAVHTRLKKHVAFKVIREDITDDQIAVERFVKEVEATGQLAHPNIVTAFDAGEQDGMHYLVMELVDGIDARQLIRSHGPLSVPDACEVIRQATAGIEFAHQNGMVHRDIKPSNLMIDRGGNVKVMDFGLASLETTAASEEMLESTGKHANELTHSGQRIGTPSYMSPEQATTQPVGPATDVYSLGCTFHFLLFATPPPESRESGDLPQVLPNDLTRLIDQMLDGNPDDRPSLAEVQLRLQPFTRDADLSALSTGQSSNPGGCRPASPPDSRFDRLSVSIATCVLLGLTIIILKMRPSEPKFADQLQVVETHAVISDNSDAGESEPVSYDAAHEDLKRLPLIVRHSAPIVQVGLSPDGKTLASVFQDGVVALDAFPSQGGCTLVYDQENQVGSCMSADGSTLASINSDGKIVLIDLTKASRGGFEKDLVTTIQTHLDETHGRPTCLALSRNGRYAYCGFERGRVVRLDVASKTSTPWTFHASNTIRQIRESPHQDKLAIATDASVLLVDTEDPKQRNVIEVDGAGLLVFDHVGGKLLATRNDARELCLIDGDSHGIERTFQPGSAVQACAFLPGNQHFLTGSNLGAVSLWHVNQKQSLSSHTVHDQPIQAVCGTLDGRYAVAAGAAGRTSVVQLPVISSMPTNNVTNWKDAHKFLRPIDSKDLGETHTRLAMLQSHSMRAAGGKRHLVMAIANHSGGMSRRSQLMLTASDIEQLSRRRPDLSLFVRMPREVTIHAVNVEEPGRTMAIRSRKGHRTTVLVVVEEAGSPTKTYEELAPEMLEKQHPEAYAAYITHLSALSDYRPRFPISNGRSASKITRRLHEMMREGHRRLTIETASQSVQLVEMSHQVSLGISTIVDGRVETVTHTSVNGSSLKQAHPEATGIYERMVAEWSDKNWTVTSEKWSEQKREDIRSLLPGLNGSR